MPDNVGGPCLDLNLSVEADVGGTLAFGFTPGVPPDFAQFVVGLSAGAEIDVSGGAGYTHVIDTFRTTM